MKTVRLSLVVALAALGLQACDINVKPPVASTAASPTTTAETPAQQPAAPVDATPTPVQSTEAPATTPVPGAAADAGVAGQAPAAPGTPETTAMGAQPATGPAVSDGVAAPTELAQFFEQNVIKPKVQ